MKKILLILIILLIAVNVFAINRNWYIDCNAGADSFALSDSMAVGWSFDSKPIKSINKAVSLADAGDTININQGNYYRADEGEILINIKISIKGYGKVKLIGKGKNITSNNDFLSYTISQNFNNLDNIIFSDCYKAIKNNISALNLKVKNCSFKNNKYGAYEFTADDVNKNCFERCIFNDNDTGIYTMTTPTYLNGKIIYSTFFNNLAGIRLTLSSPIGGNIEDCIFENNSIGIFNDNITKIINVFNSNFYNNKNDTNVSTIICVNKYNLLSDFIDTQTENFYLKQTSSLLQKSTENKAIGCYECGTAENKSNTTTWENWYSWKGNNDSVSVYSDTYLTIDTAGISLKRTVDPQRRITKIYDIGSKSSYPIKLNIDSTENWSDDVDTSQKAVIDYDTATMIRDFRYKQSNVRFSNIDIDNNSTGWTVANFSESLIILNRKYILIELILRNNGVKPVW